MKFFLVDVKSITPSKPVEQFDKAEVEKLADSILECNGLLKPLVLKPTGPESYVVIQGDMEFHAAVKAREKDPRKGEMVNAFVISPKAEEIVLNQLQTLQNPVPTSPSDHVIQPTENLSVQKELDDIRRKVDKIGEKEETVLNLLKLLIGTESGEHVTNLLNKNLLNKVEILNQKLEGQELKLQKILESVLPPPPPPPPPPEVEQAFLDFLNNREKSGLINAKIDGIAEKTAEKIINNRPYNSMEELNNVKGFKHKTTEKWLISFSQKNL